jgi:hypothetical protein
MSERLAGFSVDDFHRRYLVAIPRAIRSMNSIIAITHGIPLT